MNKKKRYLVVLVLFFYGSSPAWATRQTPVKKKRKIEEIVVTAEKVQSTVSDTSLEITAFDDKMIKALGIQNADDMVNYIPATTRDTFDIRIRGVGRNFRALGGDEGVATYYNGVYSPDFIIAATENGLYDLERVEVLRGPQGTLYGKNAIGGAINYITRKPTFDWNSELRMQLGKFNTREFYGFVSGPIVKEKLAMRLVATKRLRDGAMPGIDGSPDVDDINDRNYSIALTWNISPALTYHVRYNDRAASHKPGTGVLLTEGSADDRNVLSNNRYVLGLHQVSATTPGAMAFTNPITGEVRYGAYNRPGLDPIPYPYSPNSLYDIDPGLRPLGQSAKDPIYVNMVNNDPGCDHWPYANCSTNHEAFYQTAVQSELDWDIGDVTRMKYIFGYNDYDYSLNQDWDLSNVDFTKFRHVARSTVYDYSHELQLDWGLGNRFTATSGVFYFRSLRNQDYSESNTTPRFTQPADYGGFDVPMFFLGNKSVIDLMGVPRRQAALWSADVGTSNYGLWYGSPRGDIYRHQNSLRAESFAAYTQGTYTFNNRFELVVGLRYVKDRKGAIEVRGGYSEISTSFADGFIGYLPGMHGVFPGPASGLTDSGAANIVEGNATFSGDPSNPLTPACALTDASCAHPLRLGDGFPISWSSHVIGSDSWSDVNYRVDLNWTPGDATLMYFAITTGYRAGGYSLGIPDARDHPRDAQGLPIPGSGLVPLSYAPEHITDIEIGYKAKLLDDTLSIDSAIYHYQYNGYQDEVTRYDPVRNQVVDVVENANGAQNYGFEAEITWLATDSWSFGGNYSYTDSKYAGDTSVVVLNNPALPPSVFGDPTQSPELFIYDINRNALKGIPSNKWAAWTSYDFETVLGSWEARANYSYTGKYAGSPLGLGLDRIPARQRLDLALSWSDPVQHWHIRVFADNVTNENNLRAVTAGLEQDNWRQTGIPLYPRYWGVDIQRDF